MADTDENKETNLPDCPDSFCLHSISHCNENVDEEYENKLMILQENISHRIIVTARMILLVFLCTWLFINKSDFTFLLHINDEEIENDILLALTELNN